MASQSAICMLLGLLSLLMAFPSSAQIITNEVPNAPSKSQTVGYKGKKQFFLLLNAGFAAPTGVFASNDVFNEEAVYAKPGINIHVNVGRTFNRFVGITATAGFITQNVRMNEIVDNYNRFGPPNSFIVDYDYPGMRFAYVAGGLLVSVPATDRFAIDLKVQAGFALGIDRELTLQITDSINTSLLKYGKASDIAFMPNLGLNFRLLVTDKFTMNFFTDFIAAKFDYSNVTVFANGLPLGVYDYTLKMRNVNVGIGAGLSF